MPTREDPILDPVESPTQENPPISFATKYMGNGLEDSHNLTPSFYKGRRKYKSQ